MNIAEDSSPYDQKQEDLPTLNAIENKITLLENFLANKTDSSQNDANSKNQVQLSQKNNGNKTKMPPLPNSNHSKQSQHQTGTTINNNINNSADTISEKRSNGGNTPRAQFTNALIRSIHNEKDSSAYEKYDSQEKMRLAPKFVKSKETRKLSNPKKPNLQGIGVSDCNKRKEVNTKKKTSGKKAIGNNTGEDTTPKLTQLVDNFFGNDESKGVKGTPSKTKEKKVRISNVCRDKSIGNSNKKSTKERKSSSQGKMVCRIDETKQSKLIGNSYNDKVMVIVKDQQDK